MLSAHEDTSFSTQRLGRHICAQTTGWSWQCYKGKECVGMAPTNGRVNAGQLILGQCDHLQR